MPQNNNSTINENSGSTLENLFGNEDNCLQTRKGPPIDESLKNCNIFYDYTDPSKISVAFVFFGYTEISDINLLIGRELFF